MSLIDDIKKHEGFSPIVYQCTAGYDTIGYGQRIKYLKVTKEQAEEWLKEELSNLKYILSDKYDWFFSSPTEVQDIVINMAYQLGVSSFGKFKKTISYIKDRNYEMASVEMLDSKWARIDTPNRAKELSDRLSKIEE